MEKVWDLYIPNKEGKVSLYRLELLYDAVRFTRISIFHRRVEETKKTDKITKTYAYGFDYGSGNLMSVSVHKGDFTNPRFCWADSRDAQFDGDEIPGTHYLRAKGYVQKIRDFLVDEKEKSSTYKEKDKIDRFLSPLEKVLEDEE